MARDPVTDKAAWDDLLAHRPGVGELNGQGEYDARDDRSYFTLDQNILTPDQVQALPQPQWLIKGLLVRNTLALLWGEWNSNKTFLAMTWAGYIGAGNWWLGREVTRAKVLYVAGEGVAGLGARVAAYKTGHRTNNTMHGVEFHHGRIDLLDGKSMHALEQLCRDREYGLIIWDTIARMMPGADENSSKEMSLVVDALESLRMTVGCGSLILHHGTKDGGSARGVSPLLGACDTELKTLAVDQALTLKCLQQRDAERCDDIKLWREQVSGTGSATIVDGIGKVGPTTAPSDRLVLDTFAQAKPGAYTIKELASSCGAPEKTIETAVARMYMRGDLLRRSRGNAQEYWPAHAGSSP
jgi:hypothetical protein